MIKLTNTCLVCYSFYIGDYNQLNTLVTSSTDEPQFGFDFTLTCSSNGPPPYAIRWKRNDEFITPSCKYSISSSSRMESTLTVHNTTFEDNGTYVCTAFSYYTTEIPSSEISLRVICELQTVRR